MIDLVYGEIIFSKPLYYLNIPLRCARCHLYGDVVVDCNLIFEKKIWKWKEVPRGNESNSQYLNSVGGADSMDSMLKKQKVLEDFIMDFILPIVSVVVEDKFPDFLI